MSVAQLPLRDGVAAESPGISMFFSESCHCP